MKNPKIVGRLAYIYIELGKYDKVYGWYSIKAQAVTEFIVEFRDFPDIIEGECLKKVFNVGLSKHEEWQVYIDRANNFKGMKLGVVILTTGEDVLSFS